MKENSPLGGKRFGKVLWVVDETMFFNLVKSADVMVTASWTVRLESTGDGSTRTTVFDSAPHHTNHFPEFPHRR